MKPLTDKRDFPKFAVYDIEAEKWTDVLCVCHVDEYDNRKHFLSVSEYVTWILNEWQGSYVWAHWGGHYDHRFILHELHTRSQYYRDTGQPPLNFEIVLSGSLIIILAVTLPDGRVIKFCESARLMPDSVENIGKSVGLHKLDADRAHMKRPTNEAEWQELLTYCYRDCDIILKALKQMRGELEAEGIDFAFTLASMATRLIRRSDVLNFRHFYEPDPHNPKKMRPSRMFWDADYFACAAYFGGRTEAFAIIDPRTMPSRRFEGPFWIYDIRSSYPASMTHELPAYFVEFRAGPDQRMTRAHLTSCGITQAEVTIPEGSMPIPLLPIRVTRTEQEVIEGKARAEGRCILCGRPNPDTSSLNDNWVCLLCFRDPIPMTGGKILYIEGRLTGRWTNLELLALYDHMKDVPGFSIRIKCQAIYKPLAFIKPFVEKFWRLRQRAIAQVENAKTDDERVGGEFKKYVYKILMNAVSGKLAEQLTKTKVLYGREVIRAKKAAREAARNGDHSMDVRPTAVPGIWLLRHRAEGAFRHAAAAAYVTGRSRVWLWQALMQARKQGARVMYCDTDSIIVDKPIFGEGKSSELGAWSLEHRIKWLEIWAPKVYRYEDADGKLHYKAKGMPIERRDNKGNPRATEDIWMDFTQRFQDASARAGEHAGYYPRDKPIRESVRGLISDLNTYARDDKGNVIPMSGSAAPRAFALRRELKNLDKKRRHADGESSPLYQDRSHDRKLGSISPPSATRQKLVHSRRRQDGGDQ